VVEGANEGDGRTGLGVLVVAMVTGLVRMGSDGMRVSMSLLTEACKIKGIIIMASEIQTIAHSWRHSLHAKSYCNEVTINTLI
jgi:hypothetical protein